MYDLLSHKRMLLQLDHNDAGEATTEQDGNAPVLLRAVGTGAQMLASCAARRSSSRCSVT